MDHEKTSVMGYRTLFEGAGFHHSNSGLKITHDMHINGYFMVLFDLYQTGGPRRVICQTPRMSIL